MDSGYSEDTASIAQAAIIAEIHDRVQIACMDFIMNSQSDEELANLSNVQSRINFFLPQGYKISNLIVVESQEEYTIINSVMEEPLRDVHVKADLQIPGSLNYVSLKLEI
jgi:hypothetical protein